LTATLPAKQSDLKRLLLWWCLVPSAHGVVLSQSGLAERAAMIDPSVSPSPEFFKSACSGREKMQKGHHQKLSVWIDSFCNHIEQSYALWWGS
jgi:hypothetical protein